MPSPSHPTRLDYSNYTWRRVQITKLLVIQFSPFSHHLIPLRSKYPPQHPVLKHPPGGVLCCGDRDPSNIDLLDTPFQIRSFVLPEIVNLQNMSYFTWDAYSWTYASPKIKDILRKVHVFTRNQKWAPLRYGHTKGSSQSACHGDVINQLAVLSLSVHVMRQRLAQNLEKRLLTGSVGFRLAWSSILLPSVEEETISSVFKGQ
jgi:hypothetical protein